MPARMPLSPTQLALVDAWFGEWELRDDHSWGIQGIHVLRIATAQGDVSVKASEATHHIAREARAHRQMTGPLLDLEPARTPRMLHADVRAGILAATWLPGQLVEGGPHAYSAEAFHQAGELLALVHVPREQTNSYDPAALNKAVDFLGRATDLAPAEQLRAVGRVIAGHESAPRLLVATHGDFQPRNWIEHGDWSSGQGLISIIDWGRAGYRPWVTDLVRLEHGCFQPRPDEPAHDAAQLRAAFYAGYGRDPAEEPESWRLDNLLQALGTIVWAHEVGDPAFEDEGRRMLARVVEWFA
ncbi:phosphotransferase [Sinomonas sp. ASV486]|uniref:phosphotransferase family protein n=1 Tax=Sinomonas sp. ASV486 TaxID=3051170 RepID=UPI0027DBEDC2|nr:phosphotransferase [Sinomonas sp. ASV486]MDQ4491714.1 phosphotransferase [Sinomonas sp. ASV486]